MERDGFGHKEYVQVGRLVSGEVEEEDGGYKGRRMQ